MEVHVLYLVVVFVLGIGAQWLAWRLKLPAILLLLLFGFALGQVHYAGQPLNADEIVGEDLLFSIVSLSVAIILFEGGMSLQFRELKETSGIVLRLVTITVLVTWILGGLAVWTLCGLGPSLSAVLGAILVVSGPTVIIPLLRHIRPHRRIGSIVKWEGIVNDPIGAVLAVLVFEAVLAGGFRAAALATLGGLLEAIAIGGLGGAAVAFLLVFIFRFYWVPDYLQSAVMLTVVLATFAVSNAIQEESGLITVTVLGVCLANQKSVSLHHIVEFKENLRVVLIACLFVLLASRISWEVLEGLTWREWSFVAAMIVIVRPLAVYAGLIGTTLSWQERAFLACLAPRGIVAAAVSSVFALHISHSVAGGELPAEMLADAKRLVPITFLVVLGTVAIYGLGAAPLARLLGVSDPNPQGVLFAGADPLIRATAKQLQDEGFQVLLVDTNYRKLGEARMLGLGTFHASIVSDYAAEELDLSGIGRLLAMTPNDEVNALAAMHFMDVLGRSEVYQLPPEKQKAASEFSASLRGRYLFSPDAHFFNLARRFASGSVVKKTKLTKEFGYDEFRELYPDAVVMFRIDEQRRLHICTAEDGMQPESGDVLVSLVRPAEEESDNQTNA